MTSKSTHHNPRRHAFHPQVEALEGRYAPAVSAGLVKDIAFDDRQRCRSVVIVMVSDGLNTTSVSFKWFTT